MPGFDPLSIGLGAGVGAIQTGLGIYEAYQGSKALKNLQGQPMPEYSMSPELQSYYNTTAQRSNFGFDPSEKAAFNQNIAQQQNTGFQQGIQQSGGNLAQALSAGFGAQNLGAQNQFAGQDAQLHRQNIGDWGAAAGQLQGQQNLINQQKIQRRTQLEQAYGGALNAGLTNISSGLMGGLGMLSKGFGTLGGQSQQQSYAPSQSQQQGFGSMVDQDINSGTFGQQPNYMLGTGAERGAALDNQYNQMFK